MDGPWIYLVNPLVAIQNCQWYSDIYGWYRIVHGSIWHTWCAKQILHGYHCEVVGADTPWQTAIPAWRSLNSSCWKAFVNACQFLPSVWVQKLLREVGFLFSSSSYRIVWLQLHILHNHRDISVGRHTTDLLKLQEVLCSTEVMLSANNNNCLRDTNQC